MSDPDTVSLKEYMESMCTERSEQRAIHIKRLEERMTAVERAFDVRFQTLSNTTNDLAQGMDKRLEGMNEFRNALKDQMAMFFTRTEHEAFLKVVDADLRTLREARAEMAGKASQTHVTYAFIIGASGVVIGLSGLIIELMRGVAK
jgi:hypothetical protein